MANDFYWSLRPDWHDIKLLDSEFVAGSHVACAQYCIVVGRKNQLGVTPTPKDLLSVQLRDQKAGILGPHGTTMSGVYRDLHTLATPTVRADHLSYWGYKAGGYNKATVLAAISAARGGGKFVIVEVALAYKLPHNEQGVQFHFVEIVAYNSRTGKVCVANGDREPHSTTPDWYTLDAFMKAQPVALLTVEGLT
jgi:hypothetical protein